MAKTYGDLSEKQIERIVNSPTFEADMKEAEKRKEKYIETVQRILDKSFGPKG